MMSMKIVVLFFALVSAEETQDAQFPFMVPNWGKIFGGAPQQHYGGKPHHKKAVKVKSTEKEQAKKEQGETKIVGVKTAVKEEVKEEVRVNHYRVNKVAHQATDGLALCKGRDYVEGSWKKMTEEQPKTFKCCSWDEGPGYWKHDTAKCTGASRKVNTGPSGNKFISIGGHACMCDASLDKVSAREMHMWQPENCSMPAFNANKFCEALGDGKIHIFGDSTMQQASATLMNMIIGGHREEKQHCTPQITFHLADYLVGAEDERGEKADFHKYDADIYILGLGAWIHNKAKYSEILDQMVTKIQARQAEPNPPQFIWKTISGAGCGHINKISVENHDPSYTYDLFPTYDAMARHKLEPLGVKFVDLSPLYLRGDAHPSGQKDCLHFCAPGPVDIFPRVLHHVLQETA